jgi:hypothetical protein
MGRFLWISLCHPYMVGLLRTLYGHVRSLDGVHGKSRTAPRGISLCHSVYAFMCRLVLVSWLHVDGCKFEVKCTCNMAKEITQHAARPAIGTAPQACRARCNSTHTTTIHQARTDVLENDIKVFVARSMMRHSMSQRNLRSLDKTWQRQQRYSRSVDKLDQDSYSIRGRSTNLTKAATVFAVP